MRDNFKEEIFKKFSILDQNGHTLLTPFTVSREKKIIFFHIAKTGGSSIVNLLHKNNLDDCVLSNKRGDYDEKVKYFSNIIDNWDDYFKFTFVRNKYDQLISLYNYDKKLLNNISFQEFIESHVAQKSLYYPNYDYWIDQYFLTMIDNKSIFNFIGKFENYTSDLKEVCNRINIQYQDIRINTGNYNKDQKDSYYNDDLKQLVDEKFDLEMKYFTWKYNFQHTAKKLKKEIDSFSNLWAGGTALSKFGWEACLEPRLNNGVNLQKIDDICIRPYINKDTTVLEIGTNGGAWLKRMLNAKFLIGTDVLSPEHTGFYNNLPLNKKIKYIQVNNFSCREIEDDSINYLFSYDVFCHISYSGTEEYLKNLYSKLKKGANCFIMIADPDKYQDKEGRSKLLKATDCNSWEDFINDFDGYPHQGRWYFYGSKRFCELLKKYNYKIISNDIIGKYDQRNPIIHFKK